MINTGVDSVEASSTSLIISVSSEKAIPAHEINR